MKSAFWPQYSSRIAGRLNQEGDATGLENISPGHNFQLIPYGIFRSFRELDLRDLDHPKFTQRDAYGQIGLDAKAVLKDKFVLDATANPDFSQIESDDPQVTVNQRFEVQFPEKRPFFLENSNYFQTPIPLLFTRRIVDPQWGVRLTGKDGPWAVGMLVADDASPGAEVAPGNPLFGQHAYFAVGTRQPRYWKPVFAGSDVHRSRSRAVLQPGGRNRRPLQTEFQLGSRVSGSGEFHAVQRHSQRRLHLRDLSRRPCGRGHAAARWPEAELLHGLHRPQRRISHLHRLRSAA